MAREPVDAAGPTTVELRIEALDDLGQGLATHQTNPVTIPGTVPGDIVEASLDVSQPRAFSSSPARSAGGVPREAGGGGQGPVKTSEKPTSAQLLRILTPSPDRTIPPCRHFGTCGGCAVQHLADPAYLAWKTARLLAPLRRAGLGIEPSPWARALPGQRRRVDLTFERRDRTVLLGLNERRSHRIVDIRECPILLPDLAALIAPLRALLAATPALGAAGEIVLNRLDTGCDMTIVPAGRDPLPLAARQTLAAFAAAHQLLRISWGRRGTAETIARRAPPSVAFGPIAVEVPPAAFLQASLPTERAMQSAVAAWSTGAKRILDLFGGVGTLSLPLLDTARVDIVESDRQIVAAVEAGLRRAGKVGRATAMARDLMRDPLQPDELEPYDVAIFDPPRAGAQAQAATLAASRIATVIGVSCNPATFARDAAILTGAGFALEELIPVDQFLWSPHMELVALFRRSARSLRKPGSRQSPLARARRPAS